MDWIFGEGPCDNFRMMIFNSWLFNHYSRDSNETLLFNLDDDPEEKFNLAPKMSSVVEDMRKDIEEILVKRPKHPRYWLSSRNWTDGFKPGDCHGQDTLEREYCSFTDSWLSNDADLEDEEGLDLIDLAAEGSRDIFILLFLIVMIIAIIIVIVLRIICKSSDRKVKRN